MYCIASSSGQQLTDWPTDVWIAMQKGNNGKWRAPKSQGPERPKANTIEPGDVGIWVTCPLHVKGKAAREMELLFDDVRD